MPRWLRSLDISPARREALLPWLGRLATLAMLGLLAWVGSNIFWAINTPATPRPVTAMQTDPQQAVQALVPKHLFGVAAPIALNASAAVVDIKLNGTIAAQKEGQVAYAILAFEGKTPQVVKEGEEITPGVTLQRVLARQVEILRNGQKQMLSLPEGVKTGSPGKNLAPMPIPNQPIPVGQMPSQPNPGNPA